MAIERDTLGLAGEYAVASELCRRGMYAQLTLGHKKRTDLLVESGDTFFRVEVKTKQRSEWPAVKGIYGNSILVFVVFFNKNKKRPTRFLHIDSRRLDMFGS